MKLAASALSFAMVAGLLAGCGGATTPSASKGPESSGAAATEKTASGEKNQIIVGTGTEPTGDFATPFWQNNATDSEINGYLLGGYGVFGIDIDGNVVESKVALDSYTSKLNEDGSKTYTFKIKPGLKFSDGSAINAKHYIAGYLLFSSPVLTELGAKTGLSSANRFVGFKEYNSGETKEFKGIRLLGEYEFSLTLAPEYVPNFFELVSVAAGPTPYEYWLKNDAGEIDVVDNGNGAAFTDLFTSENVKERINACRTDPNSPSSGPYIVDHFDKANQQMVLKINPEFAGTFDGVKPSIETIIYKKVSRETQIDELKTGAIDVLTNQMGGDEINACLDMVQNGGDRKLDYVSYPRSGYGKLMFVCDVGPTRFLEVRQAIAHLLNRDEFVKQFTGGFGTIVHGPYGEGQWQYKAAEKELKSTLKTYAYSLEDAKALLDAGGWNKNAEGGAYSGEGLRYKEVDGELMPLKLRWASSEKNPVSDLLVTLLVQNKDLKAAGIEIVQDTMTFEELLSYMYRDGSKGDKFAVPTYSMFNLASNFPVAYVPQHDFTTDPKKVADGYNVNFLIDKELEEIATSYWKIAPEDHDGFVKGWSKYIEKWNALLPDLPLYSNQIHDFFSAKLKGYETSAAVSTAYGLVRAHVE